MRARWLPSLVLAAATLCIAADQPKQASKPATTASGVFLGKSGKPMAGARLILCQVFEDKGKLRPVSDVPAVTTDKTGQFTLRGFPPGTYTLIYMLAGSSPEVPPEIDTTALEATDKSPMPLMGRMELGTDKPYPPRMWGKQFTLMKGHTFMSTGQTMKIWDATVRRGWQGPYVELRQSRIWLQDFKDKSQIKFEAWSF
ncbi:MAG: carboxypeptidase-like regulatory domain-containing protein [Bryobacteraceae bacterium]